MKLLALVFLLAILGGGFVLSTHTIAPPSHAVEKVIPNEKFLK